MDKTDRLTDIFSYHIFSQMQGALKNDEVDRLKSLILMTRFSEDFKEDMRLNLSKFGISQSKYYVLLYLYEKKEELLTPSHIADFAGISRGTASELIEGLHHGGLVERRTCENDRRMIQISITEKGRGFLRKVIPINYKMMSDQVSCLDEEDVANLITIIEKLNLSLKHKK